MDASPRQEPQERQSATERAPPREKREATVLEVTKSPKPSPGKDKKKPKPHEAEQGKGPTEVAPRGGKAMAGFILFCNSKTEPECLSKGLFGDAPSMMSQLRRVVPHVTPLHLFNFETRELHGIYVATQEVPMIHEPRSLCTPPNQWPLFPLTPHGFGGRDEPRSGGVAGQGEPPRQGPLQGWLPRGRQPLPGPAAGAAPRGRELSGRTQRPLHQRRNRPRHRCRTCETPRCPGTTEFGGSSGG